MPPRKLPRRWEPAEPVTIPLSQGQREFLEELASEGIVGTTVDSAAAYLLATAIAERAEKRVTKVHYKLMEKNTP